jgi:hypothetical protein
VGNNDWLDIEVLDDYLEGKLDASTMHKVERVSLEDPFVAQALAGLTEAKKRTQTLSLLQKQLKDRVEQKPVERKMWSITSMRLSIAATAAVVFITASVLFWFRESNRQKQVELAANQPKSVEIQLKNEVVAPTLLDTPKQDVAKSTTIDKKKVEKALGETLVTGSTVAIAKNKAAKIETVEVGVLDAQSSVSAPKVQSAPFAVQSRSIVGPPMKAPASPVETLESRIDGIDVKTVSGKLVKGFVLDANGRPIPGAEVQMVGDDIRTITNVSGEFELPVNKDSNKVTLQVASLGFAKKNVEAQIDKKLNIRLEENSSALSEVVVAEYGKRKEQVLTDEAFKGTPKNGWKAYEEYLAKENKLFVDGSKVVLLSFTILPDGTTKDIKVEKSAGKTLDEEAVKLLKNGSRWEYPASISKKKALSIKF